MTDRMKLFLTRAAGQMGAADNTLVDELIEARRNGWVEFWRRPQNSMTSRYRITDAGRAAFKA